MKQVYLIFFLMLNSCGLLSESSKPVVYNTESFKEFKLSKAPDYTNLNSWAVHPSGDQSIFNDFNLDGSKLPVDVFFIYPTLLTDKNNTRWNADIYNPSTRSYVLGSSVKYQASAWFSTGDLYVPYYRQAHLRVFRESFWKNGGKEAYEMAYNDIREAFITYMKEYNNDKPIIIAGHSQGAGHAKRLLQEFFDDKPLKNKLVAAYLIGTKITSYDFKTLDLMNDKNETGGFVTWNTYRLMSERKKQKASFTISEEWIEDALCSNPITWDDKKTSNYNDHKGFLYLNNKVFPNTVKIESIDNKILVKLPKMGIIKRLLLSTVKDYHKADVNLFWEDIRLNSLERSTHFLKKTN
jgi:hypothetical protein